MTYNKKSIDDVNVDGKYVFARMDFNVPLDSNGNITDDKRITASLPTIRYLLEHHAKVVLASHLGRPKGESNPKFSLAPVAKRLSELLNKKIKLAKDVIGQDAKELRANLQNGEAILLENVRFHKEEEKNDPTFAKALAGNADIFVNDAFGTAHRAHASTEGVSHFIPVSVCGYLIQKELSVMGKALDNPKRPFVAILGGAKVSDKIGVIQNLLDKVDTLIIGGGMSYTFGKSQGHSIGTSLCEEDKLDLAAGLIQKAKEKGVQLLLPIDTRIGDKFDPNCKQQTVPASKIPDGWMGLDIGPETEKLFSKAVEKAGTVVWNGPLGVFEWENFASGTRNIAKAIANSSAISIIGGGDSAAAIEQLGFADKMTHISTGGGASLEFLEGKTLPGIACLTDK